jgi:hypothetical protein
MGTRSRIGVKVNGVYLSVYCHWDGYAEHNGAILMAHYNDQAKVEELVCMGDMSNLGNEIGVKHGFSSRDMDISYEQFEELYGDMCTFYGRDRDETDVGFKTAATVKDFLDQCESCGAEYYYIFNNGEWLYGSLHERDDEYYTFVSLRTVFAKKEREAA